jgi:hypothetical protein
MPPDNHASMAPPRESEIYGSIRLMGNMNEHHKDQKENQIKLSGSGYD